MSGQLIKLIKISFKNILHVILTLFNPKQTEMVDSLSSNKAFYVSKLYLKLKYTGTCIAQQTKWEPLGGLSKITFTSINTQVVILFFQLVYNWLKKNSTTSTNSIS